jgi:hypothetical protein
MGVKTEYLEVIRGKEEHQSVSELSKRIQSSKQQEPSQKMRICCRVAAVN